MKSINFYAATSNRNSGIAIHIHPLLLSLSETINASGTDPDISAISENDQRALSSDRYTPPSELPLLEMHLYGSNGPSLLLYQMLYSHVGSWLPRMHGICPSR